VTCAEIGSSPNFNLWVNKSVDGGEHWTVAYSTVDPSLSFDSFGVAQVGTGIYIFTDNQSLKFDTTDDTVSVISTGPLGSTGSTAAIFAAACSDGTVYVSFRDRVGSVRDIKGALYDPTGDSWGAAQVLVPSINGLQPLGQTIDPDTDTVYLFYGYGTNSIGSNQNLYCIPVAHPNTPGTAVIAAMTNTTGTDGYRGAYGSPAVANGEVVFPFYDPTNTSFPGAFEPLFVARSPLSPLSFTSEQVPGPAVWSFRSYEPPIAACWSCINLNGKMYVLYSTNATLDTIDPTQSQSTLHIQETTAPGVWGAVEDVYTGPLPSSAIGVYPLALTANRVGLVHSVVNPVTFPAYASLSSVFEVSGIPIVMIPPPQIAGGMGCLPECFDYCAPVSVESMNDSGVGGDPAIVAGIVGALLLGS